MVVVFYTFTFGNFVLLLIKFLAISLEIVVYFYFYIRGNFWFYEWGKYLLAVNDYVLLSKARSEKGSIIYTLNKKMINVLIFLFILHIKFIIIYFYKILIILSYLLTKLKLFVI